MNCPCNAMIEPLVREFLEEGDAAVLAVNCPFHGTHDVWNCQFLRAHYTEFAASEALQQLPPDTAFHVIDRGITFHLQYWHWTATDRLTKRVYAGPHHPITEDCWMLKQIEETKLAMEKDREAIYELEKLYAMGPPKADTL